MSNTFKYDVEYIPDSSAIAGSWYNSKTNEMLIQFPSGDFFIYWGIDNDLWNEFYYNESAGRYYTYYIKGKYNGSHLSDFEFERVDHKVEATSEVAQPVTDETARKNNYVVIWDDGIDDYEREAGFDADDETDALRQFHQKVSEIEEFMGATFVVKVKAVIHYF